MAPGASTGSFGFNEAKQYPNSQNYARFEVTTDFSGSLSVPMLPAAATITTRNGARSSSATTAAPIGRGATTTAPAAGRRTHPA